MEVPAKRLIDDLLKIAVQRNASDVIVTAHFAAAMKIDGKVQKISSQAFTPAQTLALAEDTMTSAQWQSFLQSKEANFAIYRPNIGRFRVNVFMQQGHVGMVIRRINTEIPSLPELNLPTVLSDVALIKRGLVILVGGTGSGKSTSLAAMLDWRNTNLADHIITIEDPIEFVHEHKRSIITQREIGTDTDSWEVALKNTLRQAPDVILMGEIRDSDTMMYALQFAETGHLCLATLHANNANQAIDRILNFFPEERHQQVLMDLSLNMKAIISQRLLPHVSGSGRVAAVEVLLNSPLIADAIFKGDVIGLKDMMARSREIGMQTYDQALFDLFEAHQISFEEALKNADSVNDLRLKIKLHGKVGQQHDPMDGLGHLDIV